MAKQEQPLPVQTHAWTDLDTPTEIATGTTTIIYRATLHGQPIAAKLLAPSTTLRPPARAAAAKDLVNEADLNARLRHPHIVLFLGVVSAPRAGDPPGLLFELASGKLRCADYGPGRLAEGVEVLLGVARALAYVHAIGVLHRDVKPSQVLFCAGGVAKLGDWGLGRTYVEGDCCTGETGTWEYMAPEVIRHERYGMAADVFSFGMVVYSVACGMDYPYEKEFLTATQAAMGVARQGLRPRVSSRVDEGVREIIMRCWDGEAGERPGMADVVEMLVKAKEELERKKAEGGGLYAWLWG